jgi:glycosyltransferase involved in cell wall biosynthesis
MNSVATKLPISIVIPTYCEALTLPVLLESIRTQLFQPVEIIVADAQSPDKTREIALSYGAKVVEGGKIAFGRNAGAKIAQSELILFLDADTQLPSELTLVEAYVEFVQKKYDIASVFYDVINENSTPFGIIAGHVVNAFGNFMKITQSVSKYPQWEGGAFILVKRAFYEKVGGFDNALTIGEDRTFFQAVVKAGGVYASIPIRVRTSNRRFDSPKKFAKSVLWVGLETILLGLGVYAGSKLLKKKASQLYGRLGGGEGKDPNE